MSTPRDILIKGGPLLIDAATLVGDGAVLIKDGVISFAGDAASLGDTPEGIATLDTRHGLIMPGLINGHCHAAMTLFRSMADDMDLETWLYGHIFPAEAAQVNPTMVQDCTLLAAAEMLLAGVTTVCDSYFCEDGAMRALAQAGMRGVCAQGLIDFPAPGVPDPSQALNVCRVFVRRWQGTEELITPAIFAHSIETCSTDTLRGAAELADELSCPLHMHLAETKSSAAACQEAHGLSPAAYLEEIGVLEHLTTAVHGVWLEPGDMELLAERGVGLVLCPESNMKLASGAADHTALDAAGVALGLGTDGAASGNNLDLLGEAATAAKLAKVRAMDPAALPAARVLDMALAGGAKAIGMAETIGALRPGMAGDVVVINLDAPHLTPRFDLVSHLIYAVRAADVRDVVVAGRQVVADRRVLTMDLERVMAKVRELAGRVQAS